MATSFPTPKSIIISWTPPEYADETKATARVAMATEMHTVHLMGCDHSMGFLGSCSIQVTM